MWGLGRGVTEPATSRSRCNVLHRRQNPQCQAFIRLALDSIEMDSRRRGTSQYCECERRGFAVQPLAGELSLNFAFSQVVLTTCFVQSSSPRGGTYLGKIERWLVLRTACNNASRAIWSAHNIWEQGSTSMVKATGSTRTDICN